MGDNNLKDDVQSFREAADKVWELALEYDEKGQFELAGELKNIVSQIHALARCRKTKNGDGR
jgi:hypothetical protein